MGVRSLLALFLLCVSAPLNAGCNLGSDDSITCSLQAVYGLEVRIVNGLGPSGQCAVTVWAVDGSYSENLNCGLDQSTCVCRGASERAGTYQVTATRSDGAWAEKTVTVSDGACHVVPVSFELELS